MSRFLRLCSHYAYLIPSSCGLKYARNYFGRKEAKGTFFMKFKIVHVQHIQLNLNIKKICNVMNNYFVIDQYLHTEVGKVPFAWIKLLNYLICIINLMMGSAYVGKLQHNCKICTENMFIYNCDSLLKKFVK